MQYLINNAGVASWGGLGQLTEDELLHCIRTNTVGPLMVTQEVLGAGLLQKGSVVANLTSKVMFTCVTSPLSLVSKTRPGCTDHRFDCECEAQCMATVRQ